MQKKFMIIISIMATVIILLSSVIIYLVFFKPSTTTNIQNNNNNSTVEQPAEEDNSLNLPTEGNDTVLTTNSKTKIRVINEYDDAILTKKKNLLIMFASWCPNCQEEITEIQKILEHYKNSKNVNVVVIAHEYNDSVKDLITLLENEVNFGEIEVLLDLGRVIRKHIDPEASTIPISYVLNKKGEVLHTLNEGITLDKAIELIEN